MTDEFRTIPTAFRYDDYDHRQIQRTGDVAIYEKSKNGRMRIWEVIRIRRKKAEFSKVAGSIPAREVYPGNEDWGTHGWTCVTLERAKEKARELLNARQIACR